MMLYRLVRGIAAGVVRLAFRFQHEGLENEVKEGGVFICANHLSLWDPVFIAITMRRQLAFMAKAELFKFKPIAAIFLRLGAFPIHRGSGDVGALKTAMKIIGEGRALLIFPEGRRMRPGMKRKVGTGTVRLAIKTGAPILPMGIKSDFKWLSKAKLNIGEPISYEEYRGKTLTEEELRALTDDLMKRIDILSGKEEEICTLK